MVPARKPITSFSKRLATVSKRLATFYRTALASKDPTLWVFSGQFIGNTKYLYLWLLLNRPDLRPLWFCDNARDLEFFRRNCFPAVAGEASEVSSTLKRASVHIVQDGGKRWRHLMGGSRYINLWHGSGVKRFGPGSKSASRGRALSLSYLLSRATQVIERHDIVASTSACQQKRLSACFRVALSQVPVLGSPRIDVFFDRALYEKAIGLGQYNDTLATLRACSERYVYMPTLRESVPNFLAAALPDPTSLNHLLAKRAAVLFIKLHPATPQSQSISGCPNIRMWPPELDIYPVLPKFDVLISDYSSVIFDFIRLPAPRVVNYRFDMDRYQAMDRDFALSPSMWTLGPVVSNFASLCELMATAPVVGEIAQGRLDDVRLKFWNDLDTSGCKSVADFMENMLSAHQRTNPGARKGPGGGSRGDDADAQRADSP